MGNLNQKGLKLRKQFLELADQDFLDCLEDKDNLSKFNALCDVLSGGGDG